ncbi:hypothetical protein Q9966_011526, partial [Columba livia]
GLRWGGVCGAERCPRAGRGQPCVRVPRPVRQIVQDIRDGVGAPYGAERLRELSRLLPGAAEVARLRSFPGGAQQLPEPELFMLLLTDVPSYARCLELLVLKEEFWPRLSALRGSIQTLTDAAGGERPRGCGAAGGAGPRSPSAAPQSCCGARSCTPSCTWS